MNLVWFYITITVACARAQYCQPGQERFGVSCYEMLPERMTWKKAAEACSNMGASLAVPDSLDEHQFIWEMFMRNSTMGSVWIGCTDIEQEGVWMRAGGQGRRCTYFNWMPGAPSESYGNRKDCLVMLRSYGGLWNNIGCSHRRYAICEYATPEIYCLQADANGRFASLYKD